MNLNPIRLLLLALVSNALFSAYAGEDMAMLAMEQRERVLAQLTAKKFPADIATSIADLARTDVPTRETAGKLLLSHADRKTVVAALIAAAREDDPDKRPNAATLLVKLGEEDVQSVLGPLMSALGSDDTRARRLGAFGNGRTRQAGDARADVSAFQGKRRARRR